MTPFKGDDFNHGDDKMVCRGVIRDECAKNWERLHLKPKDHSRSSITRFFKIMFGKDFKKVLHLPPKFARSVRHLAGQETQIEDSSGLRWPVTFSYVDGSLAFHKGWNKFYVDHGLEEGHLLIFNFIQRSHFAVQIFGESACETTDFDNMGRRRSKRLKTNMETIFLGEPFQTTDINSRERPSSSDSVASRSEFWKCQMHPLEMNANVGKLCRPISMNMEDPSCMINRRDDICYREEGRDILYDLSRFEMKKKLPDENKFEKPPCIAGITERSNAKTDDNAQMDVIHANEINGHSNDVDKLEEALGTKKDSFHNDNTELFRIKAVFPTNKISGDYDETCVRNFNKASDNKVAPSHAVKTGHTKEAVIHETQVKGISGEVFADGFVIASGKKISPSHAVKRDHIKIKGDDTQMAAFQPEKISGSFDDILTDKFRFKPSQSSNWGKKVQDDVSTFQNGQRAVKIEQVELRGEGKGVPRVSYERKPTVVAEHGQMLSPVVKIESDLPYDTVTSGIVSPFSAEVKSQSYLELPVHIPSAPGRRERGRGKVIYLRDPSGRLWPMLHPDLFTIKALTGNWRHFCKQNGIKPGDKCRFEVENEKMCYYRVGVTHCHRDGEFPR